MASIVELTKMKSVPKVVLDEFCNPIKNSPKDSLAFMEYCYPDVVKKVKEMCSGDAPKGDGKGDGEGGKGDGKGDGEPTNPMCASMAEAVC